MIPKANLSFTLNADTVAPNDMPPAVVWALSDQEWELPIGGNTITQKNYIRNGLICLSWQPWGVVVIHPNYPVILCPSEGSLFWMTARAAFGGKPDSGIYVGLDSVYQVGLEIVAHALPMLAERSPDTLTPRIVASIQKYGVVKGEYLCRTPMPPPSVTSSTEPKTKRSSASKGSGKKVST